MRVALVHDYLYVYGGAERALEQMHAIWPDAPIYTLLHVRDRLPGSFQRMDIRATWVDRLPGRLRWQRLYALWQPLVFAALRLDGYDMVLSSASFGAKAVAAVPPGQHVCYCYTPPRFLWGPAPGLSRERLPVALRLAARPLEAALRRWDYRAAQRVDSFVAISQAVAGRIQAAYGRSAAVIYPPVPTERFRERPAVPGTYWLVVARLEAYKRVDLAIAAANALGDELVIVGQGVEGTRLRRLAGPTVRFLGHQSEAAVAELLARCRGLLFPGEDDFGLTPVEANAAGKPVIAYAAGGAVETLVPDQTAVLFTEPTPAALADAMHQLDPGRFDPTRCREQAARFAPAAFRQRLRSHVEEVALGRPHPRPPAADSRSPSATAGDGAG